MTSSDEHGNGTATMAEYFDRLFGPVLSSPWAARLIDTVGLNPGETVLDVACGSGAVAIAAHDRVGPTGAVAGLDLNPDMLAVARRKQPEVQWTEGRAENLPFSDQSFDVALCQFGLMFFDDPPQAMDEIRRVLRPSGRVAVAVWDRLDRTPGYAALVELVERRIGAEAAQPIRSSFAMGDTAVVRRLLQHAGFESVDSRSVDAQARFPSLRAWVDAELKGWADASMEDSTYAEVVADAERALAPYLRSDGSTDFILPAVVGVATKP